MNMYWKMETITPEKAKSILEKNKVNRNLNRGTVMAYAEDMKKNRWDTATTACIAIGKDGDLKDGQHRLNAVILADKPVKMWICRGVGDNVVFDCGRNRSLTDYMRITYPDIDKKYQSNAVLSLVRLLVTGASGTQQQKVSQHECEEFLFKHKKDFDEFFAVIPYKTKHAKISVSLVYLCLFMAYKAGVPLDALNHFYQVITTGMGDGTRDYPIIAYRNYLLSLNSTARPRDHEIKLCQGAIKKYLTNSGLKRVYEPKELIYPYPYKKENDK